MVFDEDGVAREEEAQDLQQSDEEEDEQVDAQGTGWHSHASTLFCNWFFARIFTNKHGFVVAWSAEYGVIMFKKTEVPKSVEPQPFPGWRNLCARILRKAPDQTYGMSTLKKKALRLISAKFEAPMCSKTKRPLSNAAMLTKMKSQLRKSPRFKYNVKDKTATLVVFKKKISSNKNTEKIVSDKKTKKIKNKKEKKAESKKKKKTNTKKEKKQKKKKAK